MKEGTEKGGEEEKNIDVDVEDVKEVNPLLLWRKISSLKKLRHPVP